ncbi:hypothetical protein KUTeg_011539 [Tegillarca granosa]|uniref:Cyclic nucleotide-binding domain-containing protein n=1 Tax=Tegillarca granosa TaxID=220873 RepID=A0ABQ9EX84_TEGGR|nr:hypothetical protein KUTeg_011539 [Tegillarca granosa]
MPTMYEKVVSVIEKDPEQRNDFECVELISWFRNKSSLFQTVKAEIIKDVIRHCIFESKVRDEVIIKQGDCGDRLFIILKGKVSIYVVQEGDSEGQTVGEIALIKEDCIRTASVVVDEDTDLMVVDRTLYNRSVRDVLEREFNEKTEFVENNPLFHTWPPRQKKSMAIALKKESYQYGAPVTKQGHTVDNIYFILQGELEIIMDLASHKTQYPTLWDEMTQLLPELLPNDYGLNYTPYEKLIRKRSSHKPHQMCLLGANEVVGAVEVNLGLKTYFETSTVTRQTEVLVLSTGNYHRLFSRKVSSQSVEILKEMLTMRLYLYIHRSELSSKNAPLLKYLTLKLRDTDALKNLKSKKKKRQLQPDLYDYDNEFYYGYYGFRRYHKAEDDIVNLMKLLDIPYFGFDYSLPEVETSTSVVTDIETRKDDWIRRSKGVIENERPKTAAVKEKKRYIVEALNEPPKLETLLRAKTVI